MRYHGALCTPDKNHVKKAEIILVMLELGAMLLMIADRRAYIYRGLWDPDPGSRLQIKGI